MNIIGRTEQLLQRGSSVASSLLPTIFAIFSRWRLNGTQQMTLLGLGNEKTLYNWKSRPEKAKLTRDLLERASYILGIYKSLETLLPNQALADRWLATPNDNPLFNGAAPLDRLLAGQVADLAAIRNFLDAERGGPVIAIDTLPSSEIDEPVYRVIPSRYPQISLFERGPDLPVMSQPGSTLGFRAPLSARFTVRCR